jgi:hypothetical protein
MSTASLELRTCLERRDQNVEEQDQERDHCPSAYPIHPRRQRRWSIRYGHQPRWRWAPSSDIAAATCPSRAPARQRRTRSPVCGSGSRRHLVERRASITLCDLPKGRCSTCCSALCRVAPRLACLVDAGAYREFPTTAPVRRRHCSPRDTARCAIARRQV